MGSGLEEHDTSGFAYDHNGTAEAFQASMATTLEKVEKRTDEWLRRTV